ncbi:MAG: hypothetical protein U9Q92_04240 [archaeon]|nr:hypothetical protein [archaeon]
MKKQTVLIVATLVTILISGATVVAMNTATAEAVEVFTMQTKFDGNQMEELTSFLQWCNPNFEYSFHCIGNTTIVMRRPTPTPAPWINIDSTKVLTETDIQIKGTSNLGPNTKIMLAGYSDVDHDVYPLGDASKNADGTWSGEAHPASCSVIRAEYITVYVFALSCSDELWPLKVPMTKSELLDFLETNSCCHEVVKVHRPCGCCGRIDI